MQKVIIFDSPDGTGKTNIAQALSERINVPYFKMDTEHQNWRSGKFKTALEFDQTYLLQMLKQTKYSIIIDRAYPAEWVYSKVYKRETNDELLKTLDEEFAKMGTTIVIPLRHDYSKNRKDELVSHEMLPKLHKEYLNFAYWTNCNIIPIYVDEFEDDINKELSFIEDYLRAYANRV